jgi:plasmid stabilization system protein ParE
MSSQRPKVKIRFRFNYETGRIEDFIIDDQAAGASEEYHDLVAEKIASLLARSPEIFDAGPRLKAEALAAELEQRQAARSRTDRRVDNPEEDRA